MKKARLRVSQRKEIPSAHLDLNAKAQNIPSPTQPRIATSTVKLIRMWYGFLLSREPGLKILRTTFSHQYQALLVERHVALLNTKSTRYARNNILRTLWNGNGIYKFGEVELIKVQKGIEIVPSIKVTHQQKVWSLERVYVIRWIVNAKR